MKTCALWKRKFFRGVGCVTSMSVTGRAMVDGVPGVSFFAEAEDLGSDADTFRIVLGDGYAAGGVLLKGKVVVTGGLLTP